MPSNKPQIKAYTTEEVLYKMNYISKKEHRTTSKTIEMLCQEYIIHYEAEHGIINLPDQDT